MQVSHFPSTIGIHMSHYAITISSSGGGDGGGGGGGEGCDVKFLCHRSGTQRPNTRPNTSLDSKRAEKVKLLTALPL